MQDAGIRTYAKKVLCRLCGALLTVGCGARKIVVNDNLESFWHLDERNIFSSFFLHFIYSTEWCLRNILKVFPQSVLRVSIKFKRLIIYQTILCLRQYNCS